MEFEFIEEAVEHTPAEKKYKFATAIAQWDKTTNKTIRFKCSNAKERLSCYTSARSYIKRYKLDYTIFMKGNEVYIVRA